MAAWRGLVVAVTVAGLLSAGCAAGSGEPDGLSGATATIGAPDSTDGSTTEPNDAADQDDDAAAEPEPTFTQPYVPGDPSVIAVPEQLPVETALDLGAQEQDVADALGQAMAAWDAMLFGVDVAEAGIQTWFGRALLVSLRDYAAESQQMERVNVGSPTRIVLHDVEVADELATIEACFYTDDRVKYVGGEEGEPVDAVSGYQMPAEHDGANWRFTDAVAADELSC